MWASVPSWATRRMRASLYNAMPLEGAKALAEYMKDFEVAHNV